MAKNRATKIQKFSLFLYGIKPNKILNVLKSGYPKEREAYNEQCKKECYSVMVNKSLVIAPVKYLNY